VLAAKQQSSACRWCTRGTNFFFWFEVRDFFFRGFPQRLSFRANSGISGAEAWVARATTAKATALGPGMAGVFFCFLFLVLGVLLLKLALGRTVAAVQPSR
jgi:hypothetical protein